MNLSGFFAPLRQSPEELVYLRAIAPRNAPAHLIRDYQNQAAPPSTVKRVAAYPNLSDGKEYMEDLREQNKRRGIYAVINPGGDADLDIKRYVDTYSESDPPEGVDVAEFLAAQRAIEPPLPSSAEILTYKSIHRHLFIDGSCTREEWLMLQQGQIAYYKSDPSIMNESRVMRLPGFNHVRVDFVKDRLIYKPIELISFYPERKYNVGQLQAAFPVGAEGLLKVYEKLSRPQYKEAGIEPSDELRREVEAIRKQPRSSSAKAPKDNTHDKITTLAEVLQRERVGERLKRIVIEPADYGDGEIEPADIPLIEGTIERMCLQLANADQGKKDNTLLHCGQILYGLVKGELTDKERIDGLLMAAVRLGHPSPDIAHAEQTMRNAFDYAEASTIEGLRQRSGNRQGPEEPPDFWPSRPERSAAPSRESNAAELKKATGKELTPIAVSWADFDAEQFMHGERIAFAAERGEIALMNALPNAGKTTLALIIALCLAIGRRFSPLVTEEKQRRVLYIDGETRRARLQRDLRTMTSDFSREEAMAVGENLHIICEAEIGEESLALTRNDHLIRLSKDALRVKPDLIVIDTLSSLCPVFNENDNAEQTRRVWRPLQKLARDCDAAILVLHHVGKRSEDSQAPERVYRGRGASASGGAARAVWLLIPDPVTQGLSTLACVKAKGDTPADVRLQLDPSTRWMRTIEALPPGPPPLEIVVAAVKREMATSEIVDALKDRFGERSVKNYLTEAVGLGKLKRPRTGVYAPQSAESAESAEDENAQVARVARPQKGKSAKSASVIGAAQVALSCNSQEVNGLHESAKSATPIEDCTSCTPDELDDLEPIDPRWWDQEINADGSETISV